MESGKEEGKINTLDAGISARAGFEMGNVLLTAFFSQGLTGFYHSPGNQQLRHQVKGISLGFWLNKAKAPTAPSQPSIDRDTDNDGIPDSRDLCPDQPGPALSNGCPDKDNDGVADTKDQCPDVPGKAKYGGCPVPDSDGDGINDEADACPDKAGVPEFNGCPIPDSDGDGLHDLEDQCPIEAGPKENNGCPVRDTVQRSAPQETAPKPALPEGSAQIYFDLNSQRVDARSTATLEKVILLLQEFPAYQLVIEGHADATGSTSQNQALSLRRAETVKNYLAGKGIEKHRLHTAGLGAEKPVATNDTPEGRAANRRAELKWKE